MATVGSLFINVKARTASFGKKMKGVRATITRMAKGFVGLAVKVAKFAAVLGGVAVVAIIALTVKGLKAVDTMAKLAQNIGASVKSIQVLRHMATLGGVSIEKMDKSMAKMVKNVGESAMGIGTATDALKELGLNATDLEKMSPEVMFGVLADEINKLPTAARRASVAYDIMGRAGQELLVTMKGGSAGISAMTKKLESLGVIIGDKQAQMVEKANDAWADIGLVWQGLSQQLAVEFAPILTTIANKIVEFVKNSGGMGKIAEGIVKAFFYVGAGALDVIRSINLGWQIFKTATLQAWADVFTFIGKVVEKSEILLHEFFRFTLKAASTTSGILSWMAKNAGKAAEAIGADTLASILKTATSVTNTLSTVFGVGAGMDSRANTDMSDWLKEMGIGLQSQADESADALLKTLSEGWNLEKVPNFFKSLRDSMMGEGFDLGGGAGGLNIELQSSQIKGAVDTLQTAIGGFKVEGDGQTRLLQSALKIDQKQLSTSKEILKAITQQGGGFLL